jgi:tetratricopeptide (TPR) repeat protein
MKSLRVLMICALFVAGCASKAGNGIDIADRALQAQQAGNITLACSLYEEALREARHCEDELILAEISNSLAVCYLAQDDVSTKAQAEKLLRNALDLWTKNGIVENPTLAYCLNNLGVLSLSRGDLLSARNYLMRSYEIRRRVLGAEHAGLLSCCHNLGVLEFKAGNNDRAQQWFENALAIAQKSFGDDSAEAKDQQIALAQLAAGMPDLSFERTAAVLAPTSPSWKKISIGTETDDE